VIVAEPSDTAVTTPLFTVATVLFELVQLTVLFVASDGLTVAVRLAVAPISRLRDVWLMETLATEISRSSSLLQDPSEENRKIAVTMARKPENSLFSII
jgi:hypothetical protein